MNPDSTGTPPAGPRGSSAAVRAALCGLLWLALETAGYGSIAVVQSLGSTSSKSAGTSPIAIHHLFGDPAMRIR